MLKGKNKAAHLRSVMDMRRRLTGGTQCIATSAPLPFSTRQDPAQNTPSVAHSHASGLLRTPMCLKP